MKPGYFLLSALLITLAVLSCSKSGSGSKPKLSLESINTTVVPGDSMRATFKFSGGSIVSGTLISLRSFQQQDPPLVPSGNDTVVTPIPSFPGGSGQLRYGLDYDYLSASSSAHRNDTVVVRFFVLTSGNVSSDTISSPKIAIINP